MADYNIPENCSYTKEDEWVRSESPSRIVIGITDYAQQQLGDVVFVELPEPGTAITIGEPFGVIESVKAVSDLYAPITGELLAINEALEESPEIVNADCYGEGFLLIVQPAKEGEFDALLDATGYKAFIAEREE